MGVALGARRERVMKVRRETVPDPSMCSVLFARAPVLGLCFFVSVNVPSKEGARCEGKKGNSPGS